MGCFFNMMINVEMIERARPKNNNTTAIWSRVGRAVICGSSSVGLLQGILWLAWLAHIATNVELRSFLKIKFNILDFC